MSYYLHYAYHYRCWTYLAVAAFDNDGQKTRGPQAMTTTGISKLFEYCFMDSLQLFLTTESNQFGFKKGIGCSHAVYTVRQCIERNVMNGCTVNLCTMDLSKAFDRVNHHALFIKLMKRYIPAQLLEMIENLFSCCYSCVKWNGAWSCELC